MQKDKTTGKNKGKQMDAQFEKELYKMIEEGARLEEEEKLLKA